ncbi:CARDB domain-containing protein [Variovorax sp. J22P240]|uniref:CARDB domain-containing protein n=1 Tax=Variovorax sp. J22P240 TaxID=3053514 RepID=UPI002574C145|nr:CARDB domain-containing protein [Variovorax sp. J22P240]MDM0001850.1 CARDB domain-containing protein [Variovorax sp. J22P240]
MANILPAETEIFRDKQKIVRRVSHARAPYRPSGFVPASPVTLAAWYLERFGDQFGLSANSLATLASAVRAGNAAAQTGLELSVVRADTHTTVVSYAQTYAGLPVFEAGLSVKMHSDLSAVIGVHSTLHLDIQLDQKPLAASTAEAGKFSSERLAQALGLAKEDAQPELVGTVGLAIYRYLPKLRFEPSAHEEGQPESSPTLELPRLPEGIVAGRHYVVRNVEFSLELPDWGHLHWRALLEWDTDAVLYLRAFVESCTGSVFRDDPVTISGDLAQTPCAAAATLDPLGEEVALAGLQPPAMLGDPQALRGEFIEIVDTDAPAIAPPTAVLPACQFDFSAPTDDFAAVNAYHHMDALYRMVADMGFVNYFPGTVFPVPTDHQGEGGAVNAHHYGTGNGTTKFTFGLAQNGCPVGIACDRRVVIHEFGHSVLRNNINSGTFTFVHGVGDTLAVILSDPSSKAPDRFDTFPFNSIDRRHDRDVAAGWGWGGANDTGGYSSEQILSTTGFRAYRSLGGDSNDLTERQFAARYMTYLILAAVRSETPVTQPANAEDFAADLIEADLATTTFAGQPGGTFHKVVRWAFEKQDAFGGEPPEVDVYIDDGRAGEYPWLDDFTHTPGIWSRLEPDAGTTHQNPLVGTPAYLYARVHNRGTLPAAAVTVKAFSGPQGGVAVWPNDFAPLASPELPIPGAIAPGSSVVVGPFEWTPATSSGASILMSTSTPKDTSNADTVTGSLATRRLVPFDNNLGQRDLTVSPYPVQYSVKFVCGSAGSSCSGDCGPVAPGAYFTAINIHNPTDRKIRFRKNVAIALPGERPGHVTEFTFNTLGPYEALEIDCADIYRRVGLPGGCFLKGFVVIESVVELDVVAVYSAAGADKHVETLDIEYVKPRIARHDPPPPGKPRLPDLVPLPAFAPPPVDRLGQLPQNFCFSTTGGNKADALRIVVRNQGEGDAPKSITRVVFKNNPPLQIETPPIPVGGEVMLEAMIPNKCFVGESPCSFVITVDATSVMDESNETNNEVSGSCPGIAL